MYWYFLLNLYRKKCCLFSHSVKEFFYHEWRGLYNILIVRNKQWKASGYSVQLSRFTDSTQRINPVAIAFSDSNIDWNTMMPFLYSSIVSQNGKINTQNRVKAIYCNRVADCECLRWNHRHHTQRLTQQDQIPRQCPGFTLGEFPMNNVYLDYM